MTVTPFKYPTLITGPTPLQEVTELNYVAFAKKHHEPFLCTPALEASDSLNKDVLSTPWVNGDAIFGTMDMTL